MTLVTYPPQKQFAAAEMTENFDGKVSEVANPVLWPHMWKNKDGWRNSNQEKPNVPSPEQAPFYVPCFL